MTSPSATPASRRNAWPLVVGGCALLAVCAALLGAAGAGWWWFTQRQNSEASEPAVEYVVDASQRMALPSDATGNARLSVARSVLAEVIRPAGAHLTAGLRVFGTGIAPDACQDTDLVVPLAPANQGRIADQLSSVQTGPSAEAALAEALLSAIRDLARTRGPHTLVVVTGGEDSCYPEVGPLVAREARQAGIQLELFLVGFQVSAPETGALKSFIDLTPGAVYLDARDEAHLRAILAAIQTHIDAPGTIRVSDVIATAQAAGPGLATQTPGAQATGIGTATTREATAVGTPIATSTPVSGYQSQTACDHPYLPLRPGATWTYSAHTGTWTIRVDDAAGDLETASATLTRGGATTDTTTWQCGHSGIASDDMFGGLLGTAVQTLFGSGNQYELTERSGAWLLPLSQLEPGARWSYGRTVESREATGLAPLYIWMYEETLTVAGVETITLAGDTLQALRVDSTFTFAEHGSVMVSGSESYWFAQGVGLVRMQHDIVGADSLTLELQSYRVP